MCNWIEIFHIKSGTIWKILYFVLIVQWYGNKFLFIENHKVLKSKQISTWKHVTKTEYHVQLKTSLIVNKTLNAKIAHRKDAIKGQFVQLTWKGCITSSTISINQGNNGIDIYECHFII